MAKKAPVVLESENIAKVKAMALADLKFFARNIYWHGNEEYQSSWGTCHDFMVDFLRLDELGSCVCHSGLDAYLPPKVNGIFPERWLYWPVFGEKPQVQDGPEGKISDMFSGSELWKGVLIRIAGDGRTYRSLLFPRYHLKSQIATQIRTLWEIIRNPNITHVVRTQSEQLSEAFLSGVKMPFDNQASLFFKLWGHLKPVGRDAVWSKSAIKVNCSVFDVNPTLATAGINSDVTGTHPHCISLDDVSVEQNTDSDEKCQQLLLRMSNMLMTLPKNGRLFDIGTKWANNDSHFMFTNRQGTLYSRASFLIGTVKMADDSLLWKEWWNEDMYRERVEGGMNNEFQVYCNFFNQPIAGRTDKFDPEWLKFYTQSPEQLAIEKKLQVAIFCDPAESEETRADSTCIIVKGQTQDGTNAYILEVIQGQWSADVMPEKFADLIEKWWELSKRGKFTIMVGAEKEKYFGYIQSAVVRILNRRGVPLDIEPLHHGGQSKKKRISKSLMYAYKIGAVAWPKSLERTIKNDLDRFNRGLHVDVLDAEAYASKLLDPAKFTPIPVEEIHKKADGPGVYRREVKRNDDTVPRPAASTGRYFDRSERSRYWRVPERPMPRKYEPIFAREGERKLEGGLRAVPKKQICAD